MKTKTWIVTVKLEESLHGDSSFDLSSDQITDIVILALVKGSSLRVVKVEAEPNGIF